MSSLIIDDAAILQIARTARHVAVLGIKPESRANAPAHYVPAYLHQAGVDIVPVPTYYPEVESILGQLVVRNLRDIGEVDIVDVFRRPSDIPAHIEDLIATRPKTVWFQLGIRHDEAAAELVAAGIQVVQDRCLMVDHRRAVARVGMK